MEFMFSPFISIQDGSSDRHEKSGAGVKDKEETVSRVKTVNPFVGSHHGHPQFQPQKLGSKAVSTVVCDVCWLLKI